MVKRKFQFLNIFKNQRKQPINFTNFLNRQTSNQNKEQENTSVNKNLKKSTFFKYRKNEIN